MGALQFDTGLKTYTVNGQVTISFNPGDPAFIERLFSMMEKIESISKVSEAERVDVINGGNVFQYTKKRDSAIRAEIDAVFGDGVADGLFDCDCTALAGGLPVWLNFCLAIVDLIDADVTEQQKQANPRIDHYMAKYAKYQRK